MTFAYVGNSSAAVTGAGEIDGTRPAGVAAGNLIIAVFAFENVAAGSGPWIVPNIGQLSSLYIGPGQGWLQVCWQGPGAAGVGVEVWAAIHGTGANQFAMFAASQSCVMASAAWSGEYNPTGVIAGGPVRGSSTAQVTGNQPAAPSAAVTSGDLIIACAGDLMGGGGFGSPSGFTNRIDAARSGAGTVEATIADATAVFTGATGLITFPNAAASGTTRGATATLAIIPAPAAATAGGVIDAPLPEDLQIGEGYAVRVTAVDPVTGALVSGVKVDTSVLTAEVESGSGGPVPEVAGEWFLVPGPGA